MTPSSHFSLIPSPSVGPRHASNMGPGLAKCHRTNLAAHGVGPTLRAMRCALGLSRDDLAAALGTSRRTIRRWELDQIQIDRAEAMKWMLSRRVG